MASEEVRGSFCRYDSCVITDQLATDAGALERELLARPRHDPPARLVLKGDIRSHLLCKSLDFREFNLQKPFHFRLILL